jgi:hypothetical protein
MTDQDDPGVADVPCDDGCRDCAHLSPVAASAKKALEQALPGAEVHVMEVREGSLSKFLPIELRARLVLGGLTNELNNLLTFAQGREKLMGLNSESSPLLARMQTEIDRLDATEEYSDDEPYEDYAKRVIQAQLDLVHDVVRLLDDLPKPTAEMLLGL